MHVHSHGDGFRVFGGIGVRRVCGITNVIESAFSIVETVCRKRQTLAARRSDRALGAPLTNI
jgi:hypothetical protein